MPTRSLAILALLLAFLAACQDTPDRPAATATPPISPTDPSPTESPISNPQSPTPAQSPIPNLQSPTPTVEPPTPTPAAPTAKLLTVCMAQEPENLFLYGDPLPAALALRHALYENLYTELNYGYQAQGLEKLPGLAEGDAVLETVEVTAGSLVVDAQGNIVTLRDGLTIRTATGEVVTFNDNPVSVNQMRVDFTLKPMVWSDGTPVTAADSVYSFQVAADPLVPLDKTRIDRTASYEATGDLTLRWTGLPGWVDSHYFLNVWPLLPQHHLAHLSAGELFTAEESGRRPLSNGPFVVANWTAGQQIELIPNPHYYRAAEGLPHLAGVTYKFVPDGRDIVSMLSTGGCDIVTQDSALGVLDLAEGNLADAMTTYAQIGPIFEHLDFGINGYADQRPDWFEDVRVRQAITQCTDRQRMVNERFSGQTAVLNTYVPDSHPLYPAGLSPLAYDLTAANALLEEAGYRDTNGDGIREDPGTGLPFHVTLSTSSSTELRPALAQIVQTNLRDCGIEVEIQTPSDVFAGGPDGPIFGRRFDLAIFAWLSQTEPPCHLYTSEQIPGPIEQGYPAGWQGLNVTGWNNPAFDAACLAAQQAFFGTPEYTQAHQTALNLFLQNTPSVPLFPHPKVALARPAVLNFQLDPTQPSELWNLFELDIAPGS